MTQGRRRTWCCYTLESEPHAEGCWASAAAPGAYGNAPPDAIEAMNVAREVAAGRAVGCTAQQLVALGYRAMSLDLQVTKDAERIKALTEALDEALDGWADWLRVAKNEARVHEHDELGEVPAAEARIAEIRHLVGNR